MKSDQGLFESLQKLSSKRVTQLRLYRIVLNDSRLWGRVKKCRRNI